MDQKYLDTLKQWFGYDSFRSIQLDIVRSISEGHDTLGLMPTGGGKSITFQVPALMMEGVCLVISPLISLMKDQVEHLKKRGIKAEAIYSGLSKEEVQRILDNAIYGAVKFLYVSPERLTQQLFLAKLYYMKICFITVDEAHCISQWGYDFRPPYLKICDIRERLPHAPVLALTATATPDVVKDIQYRLKFGEYSDKKPNVFSMSFHRENLSYVVRRSDTKFEEMMHIIYSVAGSVIVYTRNREKTKELSDRINQEGVTATYYHAAVNSTVKEMRQKQWQENEVRVMVATNAFGMGIDKPDVRLVIHVDVPDSLEAYFQEAGRAGRDGERAYAVLLCNMADVKQMSKHVDIAFPKKDYVRRVYDQLAYFFELAIESGENACYNFDEELFCTRFKHYPQRLEGALSVLQNAGYISYDLDHDNRARVVMAVMRDELYNVNNLSPNEEKVLNALLRNYGTLFVTLTYIDQGVMQRACGLIENELHAALKGLAQRRIIRYIPAKKMPTLTYKKQRVDSKDLRIPKMVYEELRDKMQERVSHVIEYMTRQGICRERMLMEYFGEKVTKDCGHCDVCLQ